MSGTVNQAFENNELDVLENGHQKSEPNQNVNHRESQIHRKTGKNAIGAYFSKHRRIFKIFGLIILNILIIAYIICAGVYWKNKQKDCDLQWCDGYGLLLVLTGLIYLGLFYFLIIKRYFGKYIIQCCLPVTNSLERLRNTKYGPYMGGSFCLIILIAIIIFLILDTTESRYRLISILGIIIILGLGWLFSKHPKQVLPVIFFFSFAAQILSYLGAMQWIIVKLGGVLQSIMGTTLCESVSAVANPFIGMSESPLLITPYLDQLTNSELHAILSSGFSTIAGSVLAAYISFGAEPAHLITASVMSAPTALSYSKLFYPETEQSLTKFENIKLAKTSDTSILDAATNGALAAIPIVLGIIANIVAFVSFIAFFNGALSWFGGLVGFEELSLEIILAKVFMPLSWIMGVPWEDCEEVGTLIGMKMVINEMIAYQKMGEFKEQGRLYGRSEAIATFAICGFANPGSIGIQMSVFASLAPKKKDQVTKVIIRSFLAGSAVCFLTACVAGMLINDATVLPSTNVIVSTISNTSVTTLSTPLI
ncbi:solute carrier family 28 member 3-like isoform X2 [Nylanderia fulva]|uniref:solute carrier family 28 member 3-like isoform X2 n=1 Tax=Nylanderia fulva TaxID=613905 RepID=UPI0010FB03AB|nr:solute carrier family 28 member 3-like isoform X2 [Nylanderia fulva]